MDETEGIYLLYSQSICLIQTNWTVLMKVQNDQIEMHFQKNETFLVNRGSSFFLHFLHEKHFSFP